MQRFEFWKWFDLCPRSASPRVWRPHPYPSSMILW